jgi:hypothetical protein
MKGNKSDFGSKELRAFQLPGLKDFTFEYVAPTGGERADWLPLVTNEKEDGTPYTNVIDLGICYATKLKDVPWDKETIKEATGIKKGWREMEFFEKRKLLRSLEDETLTELVKAIFEQENVIKGGLKNKKKA